MADLRGLEEVKRDAERLALKRIRDWKDENPDQLEALEANLAESLEISKARQDVDDTSIEDEATASKPSESVDSTNQDTEVEEKPLEKQNKAELLATAEAKGVTVEDGATNKDIVEAIKSKEGTE